jgi:hypothetical protein
MMRSTATPQGFAAVVAGALLMSLLTGCVQAPKPLYHWGSYTPQVYEYLKSDGVSPQAQITVLEADLQRARAQGSLPPPGLHAHLGLLYSRLGNDAAAAEQLRTEKSLFPESAAYMDFLLKPKIDPGKERQ